MGSTILPSSSILRTTPVDFMMILLIVKNLNGSGDVSQNPSDPVLL